MDAEQTKVIPLRFVWLDAYEGEGEWHEAGVYDPEDRLMVTYGYPIAMNRNYVAVASTYDETGNNYAMVINIPWGMLKEVSTIPEADGLLLASTDAQTLRQTIEDYRQRKG